eukprot:14698791-Alexandrium_andersonii.AAC.1
MPAAHLGPWAGRRPRRARPHIVAVLVSPGHSWPGPAPAAGHPRARSPRARLVHAAAPPGSLLARAGPGVRGPQGVED